MAVDKQLERNARLMELLARTALADQKAFAELYQLSAPHLYAVALRILREAAAAEEVLQESFVNVWHHAGSYVAARSQPLTWLTSIVRNRCLDQLRRREVETVTMDDEEDGVSVAAEGPTPLEMLLSGADARAGAARCGAAHTGLAGDRQANRRKQARCARRQATAVDLDEPELVARAGVGGTGERLCTGGGFVHARARASGRHASGRARRTGCEARSGRFG